MGGLNEIESIGTTADRHEEDLKQMLVVLLFNYSVSTLTSSLFLNFCRFRLNFPCVVAPLL